MGRYNQRRRAASGPSPAAAPPPVLPSIAVVLISDATNAQVHFTAPVAFGVSGADGAFTINGLSTDAQSPNGSTRIDVSTLGGTWSPGDAWIVSGQPAWIADPITIPEAGTSA